MAIIIEPLTCYKEELNMQLQCIYKSDINRNINGVIKVAQNDENRADVCKTD